MTTATHITYRKAKTGEWVVYGPATAIKAGTTVTVTKRSGETKTERVARVGRPFTVAGRQMLYGYIEARRAAAPSAAASGGICDECGQPRRNLSECWDSSGIAGMCCPRCASYPAYERSFA